MRRAQHAEDKKSCSDCGKTFHSGIVLAIHKRGHTGQKPYKCDLCGVAFLLHSAQMKHLHEHQSNDGVHDDQKTGGKQCAVCHKKIHPSNFSRHARTHTGEKPFRLSKCDASFVESTGLKRHLRMHTGEKPFECEICKKLLKGNYRRHLNTHSAEKPHQCGLCHKKFRQLDQLQKHGRIHTAERPYKCCFCHYAFKTMTNLKQHVRNLHPVQ